MTSCWICSQELLSIELYVQDSLIKPCHVCLQAISDNLEQLNARGKRKEMKLWHNEVTGEYSLDDFEELEDFEEDERDYLSGFHFDTEEEPE